MDGAFAPLKEICPDQATPELLELSARLGSTMPYQQAAKVLVDFLPIEPAETYATVRKRTIRIGEQLDDQIIRETGKARAQAADRSQLAMQLPGDRRKEFVISIDTAHVRSAEPNAARSFELVVARCGRGGRGNSGGRYFVTGSTAQQAIRDRALHTLEGVGYRGYGDVTVIFERRRSSRVPRAMPKPTNHIIDWFHIAIGKQVLDRTAAQPRRATPDLYPLEPGCECRLWKAPSSRAPRCHDPHRVGGEFPRRQANGEEAADAVVAPRRQYAHAASNCGGKW